MERYETADGRVYEIRHAYGHTDPDDYMVWKLQAGKNPFLTFAGDYKTCRRFVERIRMEARA